MPNTIYTYILNIYETSLSSFVYTVKWFLVLLCITNNSIKHQSFVYTQLNDQAVLFLTILFSISHLLAECKYQTVLFDP